MTSVKRPGSLRLLTFRGVNLYIHVSLIFLLFYVVFVASLQFPLVVRQSGVDPVELIGSPVGWGAIFALGLLISVALHEFGHALTAQAMGIQVRGITLMMLGGVSEMEKMPERRFSEFKLAVVGPLVSLILAVALGWVARNSENANVTFLSYWLGSVNFVLAIFNMLPAFPLDGGRALRSILASRMGMVRATRVSVAISKGLAWALGILGLLGMNLLLVIIAFFIYTAAQSELMVILARGALRGMKVKEVAFRVDGISDQATLRQAADQMLSSRTPILPVESERIVGTSETARIVSLPDLARVSRSEWDTMRVGQVAQGAPMQVDGDAPLSSLIREISAAPAQALPVVEQGRVVGVIRASDVNDLLQLKGNDGGPMGEEEEQGRRAA